MLYSVFQWLFCHCQYGHYYWHSRIWESNRSKTWNTREEPRLSIQCASPASFSSPHTCGLFPGLLLYFTVSQRLCAELESLRKSFQDPGHRESLKDTDDIRLNLWKVRRFGTISASAKRWEKEALYLFHGSFPDSQQIDRCSCFSLTFFTRCPSFSEPCSVLNSWWFVSSPLCIYFSVALIPL